MCRKTIHSRYHLFLDTLGVGASSLCAVHCLLMPFIIASLPMLGLQSLREGEVHPLLAGFVMFFAITSIVPGYRKHKECSTLISMVIGLALVLLATFVIEPNMGETSEMIVITIGNLLLVLAHVKNQRQLSALKKSLNEISSQFQKEPIL